MTEMELKMCGEVGSYFYTKNTKKQQKRGKTPKGATKEQGASEAAGGK